MRKNKFIYTLTIVSISILVISLTAGFYFSNEISKTSSKLNLFSNEEAFDYHIMMLLDKSDKEYSSSFKEEVIKISKELSIGIEIIMIDGNDYIEKIIDYLDLAMYSKVDGVILHAYNSDNIVKKVDELIDMNIPVITLNEKLTESDRTSYVGVNRYDLGLSVGKTISEISSNKGKISIIEQQGFFSEKPEDFDLMVMGVKEITNRLNDLDIEDVSYSKYGELSAETIATNIITDKQEIDIIYCTDSHSTLGIIQVLLDNNLIDKFILIGSGKDDEILSYMEKGNIIEATIVVDYLKIGRVAIETMYEYKKSNIAVSHVSIPIQILKEENLKSYLENSGEEYEKLK